MMYNSFYGLSFNPFDKQQVREQDCYKCKDFQATVSRLNYLKDTRGIGVITARPGLGKSYALRCFAKDLNPSLHHLEYISLSTISVAEFYKKFCEVLGVSDKGGKPGMHKSIQNQILYMYKDMRRPLILAIDEAQHLNTSILNDLKMLMNFGYDSINCFTLILSGEPYLNDILRRPVHESLRQRITVHYNFNGLNDDEVSDYIFHKIAAAGGAKTIITTPAVAAIHSNSNGNPRIIDNIMTDAITIGSQERKAAIDEDVVMAAIQNQNF